MQNTRSCVVVNVAFLLKLYIHHCYPNVIGIWKNSKIKAKILKVEGLARKNITYMKHIKIQWCHMNVIFTPKHMIWHKLQCAHILSLIMHLHTGKVYCGAVPNVHVSIFLTKKQIICINRQHPQYGFTFITSLDIVLFMVEFYWNKRNYITCVNNNLHQMNLNIYIPEKS